jgi:hypothetical protein
VAAVAGAALLLLTLQELQLLLLLLLHCLRKQCLLPAAHQRLSKQQQHQTFAAQWCGPALLRCHKC